jgi:hypothetical protein
MQLHTPAYVLAIEDICALKWAELSRSELTAIANAYYYFSVHFCETVEIACAKYPSDKKLIELRAGECNTDNLSPYPGIAAEGEKMNHDEFMRRVVIMADMDPATRQRVEALGAGYLAEVRAIDPDIRVHSLASYEDGGLEKVFRAVLRAPAWDEPALAAFHHFLVGHIQLDSDPNAGHGALCRHLNPDDRILPLWQAFRNLLVAAAPKLAG